MVRSGSDLVKYEALETNLFSSDAEVRREAIERFVKSRGPQGLIDLLELIAQHIYALENPE